MIVVHGKEIPTEVGELVDPRATALAIIDMQNDLCADGGSAAASGADMSMYRAITPRIADLAAACRRAGVPVIHVRIHSLPDGASDSPAWLRMKLRANRNYDPANEGVWDFTLEGSWGAEFIPELAPQPGDLVVTKFRSSAFNNTNLDLLLRSNGIRTLMVAGCTTEGCVESTVRDACFYDYFPVVVADGVGSDVPELHEASMLVMGAYRADVIASADIVAAWAAVEATR
jgi:nicotinamidase-related amidase